jgi:superfamily II DNA/RNA helicase
MENFNALGLPRPLLHALDNMQFKTPTPIQAQAIPFALQGRDVLGSAQTGTGKTAAFSIPMLAHLLGHPQSTALIMTPTRELAAQVVETVKKMLFDMPQIKTALLIGGDSMYKQLQQLKARPRIIVGTPGRINDHLQQGTLDLSRADFLVLDETDRMLDMGFEVQIERIVGRLPRQRQTLLFSATLPLRIVNVAARYLHNPQRVSVGSTHTPVDRIKQELIHIQVAEKYGRLIEQLRQRQGSVIVFVKTKRGADRLAKKLTAEQHSAVAIHGNLNQNQRTRVIAAFRDKKHRIMVATDVAARGLDIPHIEHVINYDLPQQPEDYIHRIGRTARAGAEGAAVCFITPEDSELWRDIHFLMNPGEKRPLQQPRRPHPSNGQARQGGGGRRRGGGRNAQARRHAN